MVTYLAVHLADAAGSVNTPFTYLTGLGFPGVIIALFISGQIRLKSEVERLYAELSKKDDIIALKDKQIEALQQGIVEKAIPALTRSTQVLEAMPKDGHFIDKAVEARNEMAALVSRIEQIYRDSQNDTG